MTDSPLMIVYCNDIFDSETDYFCDLMVDYDWLPRVTPRTINRARQIMLDYYEIVSYDYLKNANGRSLINMRQECKAAFEEALQTTQPENCLVIGRRLAKFAIGNIGDAYGQVHNIVHASGKVTKFFVIPSTRRPSKRRRSRMQRWFRFFLRFLDDEYN